MKVLLTAAVSALLIFAQGASGQAFPSKPIRILPGGAGGGGHLQLVAMRELLTSRFGQAVVVDTGPANLMGGTVARAQPDGYTLMAAGDTVWFNPLLANTNYDMLKDFAAVSGMAIAPNVLVVNPSLPVSSVKELIALAKAKPGVLNYASGAGGSSYQLAGELFKAMAGVQIVAVPYPGGPPGIQAVLSGEVQMTFAPTAAVQPFIKTGKLKALAHSNGKPTPLAPDLPSVSESGLPGYEYATVNAFFAPAKTPVAVVARLNQDFLWVLNQGEIREKFLGMGAEPYPTSPEELAAFVKTKYEATAKLIKSAGITAN